MTTGESSPAHQKSDPQEIAGRDVTLRDVARLAGVHPSTASRALDPQTARHVNEDTARRIQDIAGALGYRPNPLAQGLRTRRSHSVGLLVSMASAQQMYALAHGLEDELSRIGYSVLLATTDVDPESQGRKLAALAARHVEGLVFVGLSGELSTSSLPGTDVPTVWLGTPDASRRAASVTVDERAGITQILDHLTELGHRSIGYLSAPTASGEAAMRHSAFIDGIGERALDPRACPVFVCPSSTGGDGYLATRSLLAESGVTAIVASADALAVGCLKAVHDEGLECPRDVSVVGYDDLSLDEYLLPSLTAVSLPFAIMGVEAAKLLTGLITKSTAAERSFVADPELVIRASTARSPRPTG